MKKYVMVLFLLFFINTQVTFAQTTPAPVLAERVTTKDTNPTPTPKVATEPTTTIAPTIAPTTQVTPVPTQQQKNEEPTIVPAQSQQSEQPKPTATPTPVPPTTTPKPNPLVLSSVKKPPASPIQSIISAPFDLVMNSLPQSYYNDEGLAPTTNRILLAAGLLSIIFGIVLLKWPSLVKAKNRIFAPTYKERPYPYVAGRV
jgi:hypothetical protein